MGMENIRKNRVSAHLAGSQVRMNLNVSPYFATRYLLSLLSGFRGFQPHFDLRMITIVEPPDIRRDDIDVAVQWDYGA